MTMTLHRRKISRFFSVMALVLMGAAWFAFAPIRFGGQTVFVIVTGNSMEPRFHWGDLAIMRRTSDYEVGDIATYRNPEGMVVIHRIIARDGERFVFKGDNNTWADSYHPLPAEIIGKFWLHVPGAGKIVEKLRQPWPMTVLLVTMGTLILLTVTGRQTRGSARRRKWRPTTEQQAMTSLNENKTDLLLILTTSALVFLLFAIFTFTRPISRAVADDITFQQTGQFNYSAAAPSGIYTSDIVQTGEPVFRKLITVVMMNFDYQLVSDQPANVTGTYRLVLEIGHRNGWKWTMELQPKTDFTGNAFNASGVIDLSAVQTQIDTLEQQTGLPRQQYTLSVVPEVFSNGTLAGLPFQDDFSPHLEFDLDGLQMQLSQNAALNPLQAGSIERTRQGPNTLSLMGFEIKVLTARLFALIGLTLSLGGLLFLGLLIFQFGQGNEASLLQAKYSSLLVTVQSLDLNTGGQLIEVVTIDDLAKIAERNGRMILHQKQGATHQYLVQDGNVTYRYRLVASQSRRSVQLREVSSLR